MNLYDNLTFDILREKEEIPFPYKIQREHCWIIYETTYYIMEWRGSLLVYDSTFLIGR